MKKRQVLIIALILGFLAVILVGSFLTSVEDRYRRAGEEVPVLVARGYIPELTTVTERMVREVKVPREFLQPNALSRIEDLVNEEGANIYSTIVPIGVEEQILATKLAAPGEEIGLSIAIPKGKRAISIGVDKITGVTDLIKPGDRVDILGTIEYERATPGGSEITSSTVTILQNVLVLACGQRLAGALKEKKAKEEEGVLGGLEVEKIATVTLAATPYEAELLAFGQAMGRLHLVLRPRGETELSEVPAVSFPSLIKGEKGRVATEVVPAVDVSKIVERVISEQLPKR